MATVRVSHLPSCSQTSLQSAQHPADPKRSCSHLFMHGRRQSIQRQCLVMRRSSSISARINLPSASLHGEGKVLYTHMPFLFSHRCDLRSAGVEHRKWEAVGQRIDSHVHRICPNGASRFGGYSTHAGRSHRISTVRLARCIASNRILRNRLCRVPLPLLHFFERPHRAVQRMPVIPPELGVGAFERRVSVGLGLLDPVEIIFRQPCSSMMYRSFARLVDHDAWREGGRSRTRSCAPSSPDCAGTSSSILHPASVSHSEPIPHSSRVYSLAIATVFRLSWLSGNVQSLVVAVQM